MKEKRVAIVQSCYIPWKGYFDLIDRVDEFIFLDDAQFTRRDWRNRNRIKTSQGVKWLTVPVVTKGHFHVAIDKVETQGLEWPSKHWETIRHAYSKAPCFAEQSEWVESLYRGISTSKLSEINFLFIKHICQFMQIPTKLTWSRDYGESSLSKTERLLELCRASSATTYLSGPSASAYLDPVEFQNAGIVLEYIDYEGYPEYSGQPHPPFCHHVSILDLIFSVGAEAKSYVVRDPRSRPQSQRTIGTL